MKLVTTKYWPTRSYRNSLLNDFDQVFNEAWFSPFEAAERNFLPSCDVSEDENHYLLNVDLPGVKREDIKIEVKDRVLTISGERQSDSKSESNGRYRQERSYGRFARSFSLPENINGEAIEAQYENGVLQVLLPKPEVVQAKKIEVQPAKEGFFKKLLANKKADCCGEKTN